MSRRSSRQFRTMLLTLLIAGASCLGWLVARRPAVLTSVLVSERTPGRPLARSEMSLQAAGVGYPPTDPLVVIDKTERVLRLYAGRTLVKEYPVGLGRHPLIDKEREGDGRTPLGEYYVCTRLPTSRWHRFLGISYPLPEDAQRGVQQGLITPAEHRKILEAHRSRIRPPWNTRLGGEIGLHGGGSGADWTAGCIALENDAIEELFVVLDIGAPVRIQ